jgi:hypothetical protein
MRRRLTRLASVSQMSLPLDMSVDNLSIRILQLIFGDGESVCIVWRYNVSYLYEYMIQTSFQGMECNFIGRIIRIRYHCSPAH